MDASIFTDKDHAPVSADLKQALGKSYTWWQELVNYVLEQHPVAKEEWNFSKAGWNCRIKDSKRVIVYMMPCAGFFKASFVLGARATAVILESDIPEDIKTAIAAAKVYAEGRGVRIEVKHIRTLQSVIKIARVKLTV